MPAPSNVTAPLKTVAPLMPSPLKSPSPLMPAPSNVTTAPSTQAHPAILGVVTALNRFISGKF